MATAQRQTVYNAQISILTNEISSIDAEITAIDNETCSSTVQLCADIKKASLESNKAVLENNKTNIEAKLTLLTTSWNGSQQTIVDDVNSRHPNVYDEALVDLLVDNDTDRQNEFFTAYGDAANNLQKDFVLFAIFGF